MQWLRVLEYRRDYVVVALWTREVRVYFDEPGQPLSARRADVVSSLRGPVQAGK